MSLPAYIPLDVQQRVEDMVADETTTIDYPLEGLFFYDLQGKPVDMATIRKRLTGPTAMVYLGPSRRAEGAVPIGYFFHSALRPDVLFFRATRRRVRPPKRV